LHQQQRGLVPAEHTGYDTFLLAVGAFRYSQFLDVVLHEGEKGPPAQFRFIASRVALRENTVRICLFEDRAAAALAPLTLTRPIFELRCGALTFLQRYLQEFRPNEMSVFVRSALATICQASHPDVAVNDSAWLRDDATVFINARWLPAANLIEDWETPRVGIVDGQVAFVINPSRVEGLHQEFIDGWLKECRQTMPCQLCQGTMIHFPWDLVEANSQLLKQDWNWFRSSCRGGALPPTLTVVGPVDQVALADHVEVEPFVVADTRKGPVMIDRGATLAAFTRLEGPCYIGPGSQVLGAKVRGGTVGPECRVGGELEANVIQGYTNKYHDGFLGHSYLGEWVNVGAGTQVSDLRNDYGEIKVVVDGHRQSTGLNKVGAFIGDHTKISINSLINSGTVIGAFCNVIATSEFAPPLVPPFCTVRYGQMQERSHLRQVFDTAATVMRRRGAELTDAHADLFYTLYEETSKLRRKAIHEEELGKLRRTGV
jgi:UDP-N-acetylglucosamine diphosphorylase/glucosamine-1-phosphate N-acetyltransferase